MTDQSSSKGKGKATDWDNQSISLSEYDYGAVPRSTSWETSGSFAQPTDYTASDNYGFVTSGAEHAYYADNLSQSPGTTTENIMGSSGSAYHVISSDQPHDGGSWDTASQFSASTDATAQMSVFSSSSRTSSRASAAPSRISNVDTHINRQGPPRQRYQLPCELRGLGCNQVFNGDEELDWTAHTEAHLGGNFPSKLKCCKPSCPLDHQPSGGKERARGEEG